MRKINLFYEIKKGKKHIILKPICPPKIKALMNSATSSC